MGNAAQVEQEMRAYGLKKWAAVVDGGDSAGELVKNEIKQRTPVDTRSAQDSIEYKKEIIGPWMFKIKTYAKDVTNPKTNQSTLLYIPCLEWGSPCPKGSSRFPHLMYTNGSISSKEAMDNILASLF
jgi:hypothetical protein